MIDNKYGSWTIIALAIPGPRNRTRYLCRCDCGFEKIQYPRFLINGKTTKCKNCRIKELGKLVVGTKFGKWTIIDHFRINKESIYKIQCDCGTISKSKSNDLKKAKTTQCLNCYNRVRISVNKTHGMSNKPIYRIWRAIKERCLNKNNKDYNYYGGRGITISAKWLKFENFYNDMGDQPSNKQIDRIDNNKGYYKENCRWVTPKENCNNRRKKGESRNTITITEI